MLLPGARLELHNLTLLLPGVTPEARAAAPASVLAHVLSFGDGVGNDTGSGGGANITDGGDSSGSIMVLLSGVSLVLASDTDHDAFLQALCEPGTWRYSGAGELQVIGGVAVYGDSTMQLLPPPSVAATAEAAAAAPLARLVNTRAGVSSGMPPPWVCSATHVSDAASLLSTARELLANTSYVVLLSLAGNVTLEPDSWGAGVAVPWNTYLGLYGNPTPGQAVQVDFGGIVGAIGAGLQQGSLIIRDLVLLGLPYPGEVANTKDLMAAWLHAVFVERHFGPLIIFFSRLQLQCIRCTLVLPEQELAWWRNAAVAAQTADSGSADSPFMGVSWRFTVESAAALGAGADSVPPAWDVTKQRPGSLSPLRISLEDSKYQPHIRFSACTLVSLGSSGVVASPRAAAAAALWPFGARYSVEEAAQLRLAGSYMARDQDENWIYCEMDFMDAVVVPSRWQFDNMPSQYGDWIRPGGRSPTDSFIYADPQIQPWTAPQNRPCTVHGPPSSQTGRQTLWDARGIAGQRTLPPGSPLTLEELVLYNLPPAGPDMAEVQGAPPPMALQTPAAPPVYGSLMGEQAPPGVPRRADIEWTGEGPLAPTYGAYLPPAAPAGPPPAAPPAAAGPLSRLALPLWNFQMNRSAEPPLLLLRRVTLVIPQEELYLLLRVLAATGVLQRAPPPQPQPQPPREEKQLLKAGSAPPPQMLKTGSRDGLLGRRLFPRWDAGVPDFVPAEGPGGGPVPREGEGRGARGEQQPAGEGARILQAQGVIETQATSAAATAVAAVGEDCPLAALLRFAAGADVASHNDTSIVFRAVSFHGWAGRDVTVTSSFPPDSPTRRLIPGITAPEYDELLAECPLLGLQLPSITPPAPHIINDTTPPAAQRPPLPSSSADGGAGSTTSGGQRHPPPLSPGPAWVGAAAASGGGGKAAVNVVAVAVAVPIAVTALALLAVVGGAVLLVRRRRAAPPSAALPAEGLKQQEVEEQEQRPQQQAGQECDGDTAAGSSGSSRHGGGDVAAPPWGHGAEASKSIKETPQDTNSTDLSSSAPVLAPLLRANGSTIGVGQRPEAPTSDPRCEGAPAVATDPVGAGGVALLSLSRSDGNGGDGARQPPCAQLAHPVSAQDRSIPAQPSTPQTSLRSCSPQQLRQATAATLAATQRLAAASPTLCVPPIVTGDRTAAAGTDGPASSSVLGLGRSPPGLETSSLQAYFKGREAGLNGADGLWRRVVHLSPAYRCRSGEPSKWGGSLRRAIERWRDALIQESDCDGEGAVRLVQAIGSGSYGTVYLGVWRGLPVAAKVQVIHNTVWGPEGRARHRAVLEAAVGASLDHPNVVATYAYDVMPMNVIGEPGPSGAGSWDSGSGRDPRVGGGGAAPLDRYDVYQLRILQEFCEGGSLKDAMETSGALGGGVLAGGAAAATALLLALDIVCGLRHVHAAGIVHGDISSGNVLLARHSRSAAQQLWDQQAMPPPPSDAQALDSSAGNRAAAARATVATSSPDCAQGAVGSQGAEVAGQERQGGGAERGSGDGGGEGGHWGRDVPPGVDAREAAWRARVARALGLWRRRCPDLAAADEVAKVADFGLSVRLLGSQTHASGLRQGTPIYMAPEVLSAGRISPRSDVYSFGVLLVELIHGATAPAVWAAAAADPLRREALQHARGATAGSVLRVMLDSRPRSGGEGSAGSDAGGAAGGVGGGYCPEGLRDLAAACLATDPAQRPTLDQAADVLVKCIEAVGAELDELRAAERRGAAQMQGQEAQPSHAVA